MEITPGPAQPFEVRCHSCNCSFAAGTRQCVHCGGPLGLGPELRFVRAVGSADEAVEAEVQAPSFGRVLVWLLSAGVAIAASALQTCHNR